MEYLLEVPKRCYICIIKQSKIPITTIMRRIISLSLYGLLLLLVITSCSTTKFVPTGEYLLDEVKIVSDQKAVKPSELRPYVRQNPNTRWFSLFKTPLYVYGLSSKKHPNRWMSKLLRKIGDEPVIFNQEEAVRSTTEVKRAVQNMGFLGASVDTEIKKKRKKVKVIYHINAGEPYRVRHLEMVYEDKTIATILESDSTATLLKSGMLLDINKLDEERSRIARSLSQVGYYRFHKDYITFSADTVMGSKEVDLTLTLNQVLDKKTGLKHDHPKYTLNKVRFITNYNLMQAQGVDGALVNDSVHYKGLPIYYKDKLYLRPKIISEASALEAGELYKASDVQKTYSNLGRFSALRYTNIQFVENKADSTLLNAYVLFSRAKDKSVSLEIDGTNSAGDLGAAAAISFQHRNIFRGSETFNFRLRGAYESISKLQQGYNSKNYTEYGADMSINFPRFLFPFLRSDFKRKIRASTEYGIQYNNQYRPEYNRVLTASNWSYKWQKKRGQNFRFNLIDVNYLYINFSQRFKDEYFDVDKPNYILEYNYKNKFIINTGFQYSYNNSEWNSLSNKPVLSNSHSIHIGLESAGNLLFGLSKAVKSTPNEDGEYKFLNIPYAQYIKADFSFSKNFVMDDRNTLVFHLALGVAAPYGNAKAIPFEKRYFSGGGNSVRGWSVRGLGPGKFAGDGNFLNQSGDIKLDVNLEYRTNLFWKLRGALFVDAGNIWTIRKYDSQEGGEFRFDKFYNQIAMAYGMGFRFDFDFFVLRLDGGMKALNPEYSSGKLRYPIISPKFKRDFTFHFAVGYPF